MGTLLAIALLTAAPSPADASERFVSPTAVSHYLRARLAIAGGDLALARSELSLALAFDEESAELRLADAELLFLAGLSRRAEAGARRGLSGSPAGAPPATTQVRGRLLLGRIAGADGRWADAAVELRQAVALERADARRAERAPDPEVWRALSVVLEAAGDPVGASGALDELAGLSPGEAAEGLVQLAQAAEAQDPARAELLLRRAGAIAPSDARAWTRLARLEEGRGRAESGREAWEAALRAEPDDADALLALGRIAAGAGDATHARAFFRQLAATDADPDAVRLETALAWLDAGAGAEAIPLLESAVAEKPRDRGALFALGAAREQAGDVAGALSDMRTVLTLDPDDAEALNFVAYSYAERGERLDEAEEMLRRALAKSPANVAFLDSLGWVCFRKGDYPRAVVSLERAAELGTPDATILEHLGDAYRLAGRQRDATGAYRRALVALAKETRRADAARRTTQRAGLERKLEELLSSR